MATTDTFAAGVAALQEVFRTNLEAARQTWTTSTSLADGLRCESTVRQHVVVADEPAALGGTDTAANPVEITLAALATCQAITYRVWAAALGVPLDKVHVDVEGDIDLRGFFGVGDGVRPGIGAVRLTVRIDGPESRERYQELMDSVDRHCPVLDLFENPVAVTRTLG